MSIGRSCILPSAKIPTLGKTVAIADAGGIPWSSYWTRQTDAVLFFGEISKIIGGRLYNQMSGSSDYLTVGGSAGSYTFQAPNNATYKAADTDYIWFKTDETQRTTTEAELIGYDFPRTIVYYDDLSPYTLRAIAIMKPSQIVSNRMRDDFHLSMWWDNTLSLYGYSKQNKPIPQKYAWTPEAVGVMDADGNTYTELVIGTQTWLVENLKTTKYNDGSSIPTGLDNATWAADTTGAYAQVNNSAANKADYGLLYNWYAVNNAKGIAPSGYRVATDADYSTLAVYVGGGPESGTDQGVAAKHLKEAGTVHWSAPHGDTLADNTSGWSGRGAGYRLANGTYALFMTYSLHWSQTAVDANNAKDIQMTNATTVTSRATQSKILGMSVRCVKI